MQHRRGGQVEVAAWTVARRLPRQNRIHYERIPLSGRLRSLLTGRNRPEADVRFFNTQPSLIARQVAAAMGTRR